MAILIASVASAPASEVILKDGRVLRGKIGEVSGLADLPQAPDPEGAGPLQLILLVDNELSRIFVSKRLVREVRQEPGAYSAEQFKLRQRALQNGPTIRSVGPVMRVQPFDEFGRRIFSLNTGRGPVDVIQGITKLTPHWAQVEGISHVWEMRIATSSIPRDTLEKILLRQIDPKDIEQRKKIARFYLQCERYEEAQKALEDLLADFPERKDLKEQLAPSLRAIKQLAARQLLSELKLRREAGQHQLVLGALSDFPTEDVGGEILQAVSEMQQNYKTKIAQGKRALKKIAELCPKIADTHQRELAEKIRDEIAAELNLNTLDRLAAFLQNVDDNQISASAKLALAFSGWLVGSDAAVQQLSTALAMYNFRDQLRAYLNGSKKVERERIFDALRSQE
ncbi:MAG: hypothetical protein ACWGMZ_13370, partial [Thermoguttaceae bacterium]